jgi:hypothetical protein
MTKPALLIFGDSFTSDYRDPKREHYELRKNMFTFHDELAASGMFSSIKNFSAPGSNFWWSYEEFKKVYNPKTTIVLWAITYPGRVSDSKFGHVPSYIDAVDKIKNFKETNVLKWENLEFYKAARDYFFYISNQEYNIRAQHLIVESILKDELLDNFLLMPCYHESLPSAIQPKHALIDIFNLENQALNIKNYADWLDNFTDSRCNHITEKNHKILGQTIIEHINNNKKILDIDLQNFVKPSKEELSTYLFKK